MPVDADTVVQHAARAGRDLWWRRRVYALIAVLVASVVMFGIWAFVRIEWLTQAQSQAAVVGEQLASQLRALGASPVVSPPSPIAGPAGPTGPTGAAGARGETGPGPSQQQIDDAVTHYLTVHPPAPGKDATAEQVAAAVGAYLSAHPPAPGRPPTAEEIAGAVSTYCAGHGGCVGPAGQSASDSQVATAVAAYCGQAPSPCQGPAGPSGPAGADGPSGPPGPTGPSGAPGQPPAGWTYTDRLGLQHTCTRDNTDDSAPTYNCS